jgi:hypothetical protein
MADVAVMDGDNIVVDNGRTAAVKASTFAASSTDKHQAIAGTNTTFEIDIFFSNNIMMIDDDGNVSCLFWFACS